MKTNWLALLPFLLSLVLVRADTHYVSLQGTNNSPYTNWADSATQIQWAVNASDVGDTVLVSNGVYQVGGTNVNVYKLTNRVYISKAVIVRSLNNDPTNTIIMGGFDPVSTNGWLAVRCVYMVEGSSLIGFTLTNGATLRTNEVVSVGQDGTGGGVWAAGASSTISNCVIVGNAAWGDTANGYGGGGIYFGTVFNSQIIGNRIHNYYGGGACEAILSNCTIAGNSAPSASGYGGGVHAGRLYGCIVSNNSAYMGGGIAHVSDSDEMKAYNCTIVSNRASYGGGARTAILINCLVISNYATVNGGGVSAGTLTNCTVAYNQSPTAGGIIYATCYNSLLYGNQATKGGAVYRGNLYNCTVVGNYASDYAGGFLNESADFTNIVFNSVVCSNDAPSYPNWRTNAAGAKITFSNSCTSPAYPNWSAAGNTTNDPLFVSNGSGYGTNLVPGNYRLKASSPCVNSGLNQDWMTNAFDLDGRMRKRYRTVDMGCYEIIYEGTIFCIGF